MKVLLSLFLFFSTSSHAQLYSGVVLDDESKKPIPYVNIGIVNRNSGTVSSEDGRFEILLDPKFDRDTLRFSSIGYESVNYLVHDFKNNPTTGLRLAINLKPKTIVLNEVTVHAKEHKAIALGNFPRTRFTKAGFVNNNLGHEIGSVFELSNTASSAYLDSIQLNIVTCDYDSIFLRLNVYEMNGGQPEDILPENVFVSLSKRQALAKPFIDLSHFNLLVSKKFLVSVEIVKSLGTLGLKFYAVLNSKEFPAMYRTASHHKWEAGYFKSKPFGISMIAYVH
jgi:hypothetical protein